MGAATNKQTKTKNKFELNPEVFRELGSYKSLSKFDFYDVGRWFLINQIMQKQFTGQLTHKYDYGLFTNQSKGMA